MTGEEDNDSKRDMQYFVEAAFDEQYAAEKRLARTFSIATGLALLVGCLGLIGLATFITRQRTREMGIRKVLGAPTSNLLLLLTSDLFKWIGLSIITGGSTSYFLMRRWLEDFAHQIPLGPGVFLTAASLVLLFSFFTVSFQTFRTAMTNPVKSLRHE
jgi:putative ABC transport system permease protein